MWIPFADAVVVVSNNPTVDGVLGEGQGYEPRHDMDYRLQPFRSLLKDVSGEDGEGLGFAELRDALLAINPLDLDHVKSINRAEAEFWRRSCGTHVGDSSTKLNFECGGQQWVNESCFPAGTRSKPDGSDVRYMLRLLAIIEGEGIPAPAPIEQRWTAGSSSLLSPARSAAEDALFSWVGIIMYCQRRLTHAVDAPRLHLRPRPSQVPAVRRRARAEEHRRRVPEVQGTVREGPLACLWRPRALGQGRGRFKRARASEEALGCGRSDALRGRSKNV